MCYRYCFPFCDIDIFGIGNYSNDPVSFYGWLEGLGLLLPWTLVITCLVDSHSSMILKKKNVDFHSSMILTNLVDSQNMILKITQCFTKLSRKHILCWSTNYSNFLERSEKPIRNTLHI